MGKLFGTDGVRGVANKDLSPQLVLNIGMALATVLVQDSKTKPVVYVGKDTRLSGDMIETALVAGLCASGADVVLLGIVPTPAIAYMVTKERASAGVMISASHNSYEFNGIKIFGHNGYKLTDEQEHLIEDIIFDTSTQPNISPPNDIGTIKTLDNANTHYIDYIASTVDGNFDNIKVLVDCSNGSASATATQLFKTLGIRADFIHNKPDGYNINDNCGSTHISQLSRQVVEGGYDLAVAFDGDADRCLAVDNKGEIVDGDQMIAIISADMKKNGRLVNDTAVVTVMSNFGFFKFAEENAINTKITKVGDRYVLENMLKYGYNIGGEQSGHIIFSDYMTTGDGQLSAIQLINIICKTGKSLHEQKQIMKVMPQKLVNVKANNDQKADLFENIALGELISKYEAQIAGRGRILIRPSGTEPLIRVMAEGDDINEIDAIVKGIVHGIDTYL